MTGIPWWLWVVLGVLSLLALITTLWSVTADLRAYREWKLAVSSPVSRAERRRRARQQEDVSKDAQRWRWIMLAFRCAAFCLLAGPIGLVVGYWTRTPWVMVSAGNLVVFGVIIWFLYQIVLPKPEALRRRRLPTWLERRVR
jgi:membrane protein YdbS with pleckstrin-like domain